MDEFREEREAIKQKGFKEKIKYFCDYYKWHVIGVVALAAFVISLTHSILTHKDRAFYGAFINAYQTPEYSTFREDFAARAGIDLNEFDVMFDTSMYITDSPSDQGTLDTLERLTVYIAAGDVHVMAGGVPVINKYAYNGFFQDLRQILPQDLQEQLEPYYYYGDAALAAEIDAQQESAISMLSIWLLNMEVSVASTSRLVEPDMEAAACVTTWLPTSNTAMTISKVLDSSMTAIQALNKKRKNRLVSKSCILFLSITIVISS